MLAEIYENKKSHYERREFKDIFNDMLVAHDKEFLKANPTEWEARYTDLFMKAKEAQK